MEPYDGWDVVNVSEYTAVYDRSCLDELLTTDAKRASEEKYKIYNKIILYFDSKETFSDCCRLDFDKVVKILETVKEIFKSENPLVECAPGVHIVGDLHGSLYDLRRIYDSFNVFHGTYTPGKPVFSGSYTPGHFLNNFIFLGNYVDYGDNSLEVLMLLFSMKISAQFSGRTVIMLRGNHETREMNYANGFRAELHRRYDKTKADDLFDKFNDVFNHMPLACLIGPRFLCVHGGISPKLTSLDAIRRIPKPLERVDKNELARDLLWADYKEEVKGFEPNNDRDISVRFGEEVLEETLDRLRLDSIFRSHQKVKEGVTYTDFIITITSYSGSNKKNVLGIANVKSNYEIQLGTSDPTEEEGAKNGEPVKTESNAEEEDKETESETLTEGEEEEEEEEEAVDQRNGGDFIIELGDI